MKTLAEVRADEALAGERNEAVSAPRRAFAIGDPQTSFSRFAAVLEHNGLLGPVGWIRPDVALVSLGDHFDYLAPKVDDPRERAAAGLEGQKILAYLAAHPPEQVTLILGNHDAARVMELAHLGDAEFALARAESCRVKSLPAEKQPDAKAAYLARFRLPNEAMASREFSTCSEAQRAQVMALLLEGRFVLSTVRTRQGRPLLLSHSGVTVREMGALGLKSDASAASVHQALAALLSNAVEAVRPDWTRGVTTRLDLGPVHVQASTGHEAGGFLAHRPANPDRETISDRDWEWNPEWSRRFQPTALPAAFAQAVGHTGRASNLKELAPWSERLPDGLGPARTLLTRGDVVELRNGVHDGAAAERLLFLLDPGMAEAPIADIELLALEV